MRSLFCEAGRISVIRRPALKIPELTVSVDEETPVLVSFQQMADFVGGEGVVH